jgi:hypothetical protein
MTLPRLIACALLLAACTPASKSLGEGETGDEPTGGMDDGPNATVADDGATSVADGPSNDTNDTSCEPNTCEPCGPGCDAAATCTDGQWDCVCECGDSDDGTGPGGSDSEGDSEDTGPLAECDIVDVACEHADLSKEAPIDCGEVTFADDAETWVIAHECARSAALSSQAFKVIADMQGIDSFPRRAYVGQAGVAYVLLQFDQDSGGLAPDPSPVTYRFCDELSSTADCVPTVGDLCLTCVGNLDTDVICGPGSG